MKRRSHSAHYWLYPIKIRVNIINTLGSISRYNTVENIINKSITNHLNQTLYPSSLAIRNLEIGNYRIIWHSPQGPHFQYYLKRTINHLNPHLCVCSHLCVSAFSFPMHPRWNHVFSAIILLFCVVCVWKKKKEWILRKDTLLRHTGVRSLLCGNVFRGYFSRGFLVFFSFFLLWFCSTTTNNNGQQHYSSVVELPRELWVVLVVVILVTIIVWSRSTEVKVLKS